MRAGKVILTLLAAAFFLILLSALVVSPADTAEASAASPQPGAMPVRFLALAAAAPHAGAEEIIRPRETRETVMLVPLCAALVVSVIRKRDANGRILCAPRYEDSVYQLFRQEVAGG